MENYRSFNPVLPEREKMTIGSKVLLAFAIACFGAIGFLVYYPISY